MKNRFRLFLALLLAAVLCLGCFPVLSAPARAVEVPQGIEYRIKQILKLCPDGSYFTANGKSCTHKCSIKKEGDVAACSNCRLPDIVKARVNVDPLYQAASTAGLEYCNTCRAFASFLYYALYGYNTQQRRANSTTYKNQPEKARYGDFMAYENGGSKHYGIFLGWVNEVGGDMYLYEANGHGTDYTNVQQITYMTTQRYNMAYVTFVHSNNYDAKNQEYVDSMCSHSFNSYGFCSKCYTYEWERDSASKASYTEFHSPRYYKLKYDAQLRPGPYTECQAPEGKSPAGTEFAAVGVFTNGRGNEWLKLADGRYSVMDYSKFSHYSVYFTNLSADNYSAEGIRLKATVNKTKGMTAQAYGIEVLDLSSFRPDTWLLAKRFYDLDPYSSSTQNKSSYNLFVDLLTETSIRLTAGKTYRARLFVVVDAEKFNAPYVEFIAGVPGSGSFPGGLGIEPEPDPGGGGTGDPDPVVTMSPTDVASYKAREFVSETNACVVTKIVKRSGSNITRSGVALYDASGGLIKDYWHAVTNVGTATTTFHSWYEFNSEVGVTLTPGTTYLYRFHVTVDGADYYSDLYSFTTQGQVRPSAPEGVYVTVADSTVTVHWNDGANETGYDVYLVTSPWAWEDIRYSGHAEANAASYTFYGVENGSYSAFVIARPNENNVQSAWYSFLVANTVIRENFVSVDELTETDATLHWGLWGELGRYGDDGEYYNAFIHSCTERGAYLYDESGEEVWHFQEIGERDYEGWSSSVGGTYYRVSRAGILLEPDTLYTYRFYSVYDYPWEVKRFESPTGEFRTLPAAALPGDVNGDRTVDTLDALALFRFVSGDAAAVTAPDAADVTGDGKVNNRDAIRIFRTAAGGIA